jgi:putative ABC transport system permease protein
MRSVFQDMKTAWRRAKRSPAYGLVVIATLGLTLSALATMLAIVEAVILRPLPYREPDRIVAVWEARPAEGQERFRMAAGNFNDVRSLGHLFDKGALFGAAGFRLLGEGAPEQILGARVEPEYFQVLGVQPSLGRVFTPEDAREGAARVVIIGHGLFQRRFGGRADLLGQSILLDGDSYTVVGVMPPRLYPTWPLTQGGLSFQPEYQQLWVPLTLDAASTSDRRSHVFGALARLLRDTTIERARGELDALAARLARESPASNHDTQFRLVPLSEEFSGSSRRLLFTLTAAAVVTLMLGVANLIGLALSRVAERRHETAIRLSLGASRAALLREVSVEAIVLAFTGAAAGLALARLAGPVISATVPVEIPRIGDASIGWMPILLTCVASTLCAAGLTGALSMSTSRLSMTESLQAGGTRGTVGHRRTGHRGLIVLQVALSVILLSVAGLFSRSLVRLGQIDPGFDADSVITADVSLPQSAYPQWDRVVHFYRELLERLSERPGVVAAGAGYDLPLQSSWIDSFTLIGGARGTEGDAGISAQLNIVTPGFFRAAGMRPRHGRVFQATDDRRHPGVAVVSESFARVHLGGETAVLDRRLRSLTPSYVWSSPTAGIQPGDVPTEFRIVGVVPDTRTRGLDHDPAPIVYLPAAQFPQSGMTILVRATREPIALATELRTAVAALDSTVPVARIETLREVLDRQTARPRFAVVIVGVFAGAALLLSAVGVYGLLALVVGSRTREIAVRVAVGARRSDIAAQVIGQACWLGGIGAVLGTGGALLAGRAIENLLFDVGGADPVALTAAPAVLIATVLLAAAWPTRRALRVDPAVILRG